LRQLKGGEETDKPIAHQNQKHNQEPAPNQKPTSFMFDHQFSSPSLSVNSTISSLSLSFLPRIYMDKLFVKSLQSNRTWTLGLVLVSVSGLAASLSYTISVSILYTIASAISTAQDAIPATTVHLGLPKNKK
jgi:hypothetical protein